MCIFNPDLRISWWNDPCCRVQWHAILHMNIIQSWHCRLMAVDEIARVGGACLCKSQIIELRKLCFEAWFVKECGCLGLHRPSLRTPWYHLGACLISKFTCNSNVSNLRELTAFLAFFLRNAICKPWFCSSDYRQLCRTVRRSSPGNGILWRVRKLLTYSSTVE